ncbi:hypothetical protein [Streptomyces sp. NPDC057740]|uniref:hypothetical protein n=1 Tax=Streptomyces sp. NPDC057740 TaxID=3346234 RepID=UPI0036812A95
MTGNSFAMYLKWLLTSTPPVALHRRKCRSSTIKSFTSHESTQSRARWANWAVVPVVRPGWPKNSSIEYRGMLADDLFDYLFIRSSGHIGSLMTLINRSCQRAVRTGAERLDEELLSRVKIDQAAHLAQDDVRNLLKGQRSRRTGRKASRR